MEITAETIGRISLDDLVRRAHSLYGPKDEKRSLWDVWMHTNHHASGIAEQVRRKSDRQRLYQEIADFSMWLFTMVTKLRGQIGFAKPPDSPQESVIRIASECSAILWRRFPRVCPFCYWRRTTGKREKESQSGIDDPCDCGAHASMPLNADEKQAHATSLTEFSKNRISGKPQSVDEWQEMFASVFATQIARLSLCDIALHLMEELGEVSNAIARMYSYSERTFMAHEPLWRQFHVEEEFADVLSRLFGLVQKLDSDVSEANGRILLSHIVWLRYGSQSHRSLACWKCGKTTCDCQIIIVPIDRSVQHLCELLRQ
ncbi:MAG: MazG-like family protein [Acidobacteria bacterium]|nr:MazG-like family protein [Acidobacteriota bacterium]